MQQLNPDGIHAKPSQSYKFYFPMLIYSNLFWPCFLTSIKYILTSVLSLIYYIVSLCITCRLLKFLIQQRLLSLWSFMCQHLSKTMLIWGFSTYYYLWLSRFDISHNIILVITSINLLWGNLRYTACKFHSDIILFAIIWNCLCLL